MIGGKNRKREREIGDSVMDVYFNDFWCKISERKRVFFEIGSKRQRISYILMWEK